MLSMSTTACSLSDLLEGDDPTVGVQVDPSTYTGAVGMYNSTMFALAFSLRNATQSVGTVTDELVLQNNSGANVDARAEENRGQGLQAVALYEWLQRTRVRAAQTTWLLKKYGTAVDYPKLGHAYAMEGYAIMLLAEIFCSGVPLTDVPVGGHMQYTAGLSTTQLLERAVDRFDSAYFYAKDSLPIATFAQVGKGRALLGLGRYQDAGIAIAQLSTAETYSIQYTTQTTTGVGFWTPEANATPAQAIVSAEGGNGIVWTADSAKNQDPRLPVSTLNTVSYTSPIRQRKYIGAAVKFVVADAIHAKLIKAEAELQPPANPAGPWLATLNDARATVSLAPLADPGTAQGRVDLLFRERAFWLYLHGSRLGDLRRLVRHYDRLAVQVYPTGMYMGTSPAYLTYGSEVVFGLPASEEDLNPLYNGCINKEP